MKKYLISYSFCFVAICFMSCSDKKQDLGIDVSHHNPLTDKDWKALKEKGVKFVFIKVSEGGTFKDPARNKHWNKAYKYKLHIGAYHFFRDDVPALKQYENYDNATESMMLGLLPCIDYEKAGFTKDVSERQRIKLLMELNDLFYNRAGVYPIIYCNLIEYFKLKVFLPDNIFWIEAKSPDIGLGSIKQELSKVNNKDIDLDYAHLEDIEFSD